MPATTLSRRLAAEFLGTCMLVTAVVGSGIMAERLSAGNVALALLANAIATGAALVAIILALGPISGAHLNPAVSLADALEGGLQWRETAAYVSVQIIGGLAAVPIAHWMFGLPAFTFSQHARGGAAQVFSEFVATFGLMAIIWGCSRTRPTGVAFAVGAYITGAYWFTSSTSFANPAVTMARALTNTFSGIRPLDVPLFIAAQVCGAMAATLVFRWLSPSLPVRAKEILMPHPSESQDRTFIFACVHNAGRSQMAAALFNLYARDGCRAISAGTRPAEQVHPEVVTVMREIGIDLSGAKPQRLTAELAAGASALITMGCGESCPYVPGVQVIDWKLSDPKGQSLSAVRTIRDEIHERVKALIKSDCAECCAC